MKSCIEWRKGFKYLPQIDEFNIDYRNKEIKLINFLQHYAKDQRVNIRLPNDYTKDDIDLLEAAYEKGYNITIILPDKYYAEELRDHGTPFYFQSPVVSWDQLRGYFALGVSDVMVSGELGFELDKISELAKKREIQVRCYANIAQSGGWSYGDGFKDFYIRPEDVDFYSNYVDVIEFYNSSDRQNVLYEIYFKDKEWNGKLREVIKGITTDINNYYILGSEFARRRSQCAKKCLKGNRCQLCDRLTDLAKSLEDNKQYQVYKRRD